jgi:hypothetical protein
MFGFNQRHASPLSRKRSLDGIPIVNPGITIDGPTDGRLTLTVRHRRSNGWLARFQPPIIERRVKLDEIGSFVFSQIDGKRSTRDIIGLLADRYRLNRREAELSGVEFLKALVRRQVVSLAIL